MMDLSVAARRFDQLLVNQLYSSSAHHEWSKWTQLYDFLFKNELSSLPNRQNLPVVVCLCGLVVFELCSLLADREADPKLLLFNDCQTLPTPRVRASDCRWRSRKQCGQATQGL